MLNKDLLNVAKKTSQSYLKVYLDYLRERLHNKATMYDYLNLNLYNLKNEEQNSYLTYGLNNKLIAENDPSFNYIYQDKHIFEDKYHQFLNYNYLYLKDYLDFEKFVAENPQIMVNGEKIIVNSKSSLDIYQKLVNNKIKYLTNYYEPCNELNKLNLTKNSFIRFLIYHNFIINAYLFIPLKNDLLFAPINIETGIVDYPALNNKHKSFDKSPLTNESIVWFKVPKWPRVKRYVQKISKYYSEIKYETIDVTITDTTPILLAINNHPQYYYYQLPSHASDNYGIIKIINKIRKEERK